MDETPTTPATPTTPPTPAANRAPRRSRWRWVGITVGAIVLVLVLVCTAVVFYLTSESGLPLVLQQVERLTDGRLKVSGATGSLLSTFRAKELQWKGPTTTVTARDVFVEWSPAELAQRRLHVRTLGAAQIEVALAPSASPAELPASLGLPLGVAIDNASVTLLDWNVGARKGRITGLAFGYRGDATEHRLTSLLLGFEQGRVAGEVALAAARPFTTSGHIAFTGSDALAGVDLDTTVTGTLAALKLSASGRADSAELNAVADLTPFAPTPLAHLDLAARNVDIARFVPSLPESALALTIEARPVAGGFAGTLKADNALPGSIDARKLPVTALTATFAQSADAFTLTDVNAALAGGGRASGRGRIALDAAHRSTWALTLADVDLRALHATLVSTRISGRVDATLDRDVQRIDGAIADRGRALTLDFAARIANEAVELERARLGTVAGTLDGSGRVALSGTRALAFKANASHFDPSQLGHFPAGAIDGVVTATGALAPAWSATVDATLGTASRLAGQPLSGTLHATGTAGTLADARLDAHFSSARLQLAGNAGHAGDVLHYTLAVPALADVATLLPASLPRPLKGAIAAEGELRIASGTPADAGVTLRATATALAIGAVTVPTARVDATLAPAQAGTRNFGERAIDMTVDATNVGGPLPFATLAAAVHGTFAAHTMTVNAANARDTLAIVASGGMVAGGGASSGDAASSAAVNGVGASSAVAKNIAATRVAMTVAPDLSTLRWNGTLTRADATGTLALSLSAPATLAASRHDVRIAGAAFLLDKGRIGIDQLLVEDGRITTAGRFSGVPLASAAALAGVPLPLASTMTLGGAWSIVANPRLNGTFTIAREAGDLYAADEADVGAADYALGVSTFAVNATLRDDALTVTGSLESRRAGTAALDVTVAAGSDPGHLSPGAPLRLAMKANLASLAPLQPWIGTTAAIDGRAVLDVTATGTLGAPAWSGTFTADGLRVDSPQWGLQLADGRIRARLVDNAIELSELWVRGGEGHLTAQGMLRRATASGDSTEIKWHAEHFRLLNRPDRRIVVNGDGTAASAANKLSLTGNVVVEEGHIEYQPTAPLLGDDVVIKGRPHPAPRDERLRTTSTSLDLNVDLGRALTFTGEGLDTRLTGKVHINTGADGLLYGKGTIRAVNGTYYAFGQRLSVERGRLIFDGALDNPALDVVALRRNLAVEAGVEVTGTAQLPRIQLTSNPPVPDGEKLAWLVTGQAPGTGTGADTAALAAASALFFGGGSKPIGTQIAERFGLDDITLQSAEVAPTTPGGAPVTGQVLAVGKRLTDRLTLVYEQGLTVATNALRLEYRINRALTVRAEAGLVSGIGLVYRRSYD